MFSRIKILINGEQVMTTVSKIQPETYVDISKEAGIYSSTAIYDHCWFR